MYLGRTGVVTVLLASCVSTRVWIHYFLDINDYDYKNRRYEFWRSSNPPKIVPRVIECQQSINPSWISSLFPKKCLTAPIETQNRHFQEMGFSIDDIKAARCSLSSLSQQDGTSLLSELLEKENNTLHSPFCSFQVDSFSSVVMEQKCLPGEFEIYTRLKGSAKDFPERFANAERTGNLSAYTISLGASLLGIIFRYLLNHQVTSSFSPMRSNAIMGSKCTLLCFVIAFPFLYYHRYVVDKKLSENRQLSVAVGCALNVKPQVHEGEQEIVFKTSMESTRRGFVPVGPVGLGLYGAFFCSVNFYKAVGYVIGGLVALVTVPWGEEGLLKTNRNETRKESN